MSRNQERLKAIKAARAGQTWEVVQLLSTGISPNLIPDEPFVTEPILQLAVLAGYADTAAAIIACGGELEHRNRAERTALSHAATTGDWDCILMLLAAGADAETRDNQGFKPEGLAREHGHGALEEFMRQIRLAKYIQQQRPRLPPLPQFSIPQNFTRTTTPLGYAEPGRLSLTLARRAEMLRELDRVITDERIRPLVLSILLTGKARLKDRQKGPVGQDGVDPMGFRDRAHSGLTLNRIRISKAGWKTARPLIQSTLDALGLAFDASTSGLTCALGQYRLEHVAVDFTGRELREFNLIHAESGPCKAHFADGQGTASEIFTNASYIQRQELVNIDEWERCSRCRKPLRPRELRREQRPLEMDERTRRLFEALITGQMEDVVNLNVQGAALEAVTVGGNSLAHIGSWCGDGTGWCDHAKALATVLACGGEAETRNAGGETPLHVSAFFGRFYPCLMLLAAGANPWAVDELGHTATDLARMNGRAQIAEYIEKIGTARELYERCINLGQKTLEDVLLSDETNVRKKA